MTIADTHSVVKDAERNGGTGCVPCPGGQNQERRKESEMCSKKDVAKIEANVQAYRAKQYQVLNAQYVNRRRHEMEIASSILEIGGKKALAHP